MKKLIFLFLSFSLFHLVAEANNRYRNRPVIITTPSGPVRLTTPFDREQPPDLKGVGVDFVTQARVENGKVSVFVRGCQYIELGDTNDPELEKDQLTKLQEVKNSDTIKLRLAAYGSCEVGEWKKH